MALFEGEKVLECWIDDVFADEESGTLVRMETCGRLGRGCSFSVPEMLYIP